MLHHPSGKVLINEPVSFLPSDYERGPIPFLQSLLPKNWKRALNSLSRVHGGLDVKDTAECNVQFQGVLTSCKSMAQITDLLADVARKVKEEGAIWAVHGDFPEIPALKHLHSKLGAEKFPHREVLNSLALLRTIATHTRGYLVKDSDPSTRGSCSLGGAYLAITGSEMQGSHTACGDCRGMSRVMTELQQCRQRCESQ